MKNKREKSIKSTKNKNQNIERKKERKAKMEEW